MVINIISTLSVILGLILLILEMAFSIKLFPYSGAVGFVIIFIGVYLISYKVAKQKDKINKKNIGEFPGGGSYGGD